MSSKKNEAYASFFFYPSRRLSISSRASVYIITEGVSHRAKRVFLRLDDIQHYVLMICNSFGIDDIHAFGVIFCARDSNSGPTDGDIFLAKGAF